MAEAPLVSCLLAAYDHERWAAEAVESALAQDWPADRLEVIVVDDGSQDGTLAALSPYRRHVRVIAKPNGGLLSSINRLVAEARGELLCIMACDDVMLPARVPALAEALLAEPAAGMAFGDAELIGEDGALLHPSYHGHYGIPLRGGDLRSPLLENNVVCAPASLHRRALLERCTPIGPPAVWEDWWFSHHAAAAGPIPAVGEVLTRYRQHPASLSRRVTEDEQLRFAARELPWRRWLLTHADLEQLDPAAVVSALRAYEWHRDRVVAAGLPLDLPADPVAAASWGDRAATAADPRRALAAAVRALALDPAQAAARAALGAAASGLAPGPPPAMAVGAAVAWADAATVAADPALLAAYAAAFDAQDDVTLVLDARGTDLAALLAAAAPALEAPDAPDVVVLAEPASWPRERVRAVLGATGRPDAPLAPVVADAASLRAALAHGVAAHAA